MSMPWVISITPPASHRDLEVWADFSRHWAWGVPSTGFLMEVTEGSV